jgi:hypothetical protein
MAILKNTSINDTGSIKLPVGTTAQQPGAPAAGMVRLNSGRSEIENYKGSTWFASGLESENIVTNGLILNLNAGRSTSYIGSGTIWTSLTGSNNATLVNGPTFNKSAGGSISFDGTNQYGLVNSSAFNFGSGNFTLCGWVRSNSIGDFDQKIFHFNSTSLLGVFQLRRGNTGGGLGKQLLLQTNVAGSWLTAASSGEVFKDTEWKYIVAVKSGTSVTFYVNGVQLHTIGSVHSTLDTSSNNNLYIGSRVTSPNEFWNGNMANLKIYNRALSEAEINQNFVAQNYRFGASNLGSSVNPAPSASAILDSNPGAPSGVYWYSPDNMPAFPSFTDMDKDGGGWIIISKWGGHSKTIDNIYNVAARQTSLLQNPDYQAFTDFPRLSKQQMQALWNNSRYHVCRIHFDNQASTAAAGIYYQKKITQTRGFDIWHAHYLPVLWSDSATVGGTPDAYHGGETLRWSASFAIQSTTSAWTSYSGNNSFYNPITNTITFNGTPARSVGPGYGMGAWDYVVEVNAPGHGPLAIARHMGWFADMTSGNQWIFTNNPNDSRFPANENRRCVIFLRC